MRIDRSAKGFALSELIVVVGIVSVLTAIFFPVFFNAREAARVVTCASNLQQIAVATKAYVNDHRGPPMSPLPQSLGSHVGCESIFVCPNDRHSTDSYSEFFVGRFDDVKASEFVVGCPRHQKGRKTAIACGKGNSEVGMSAPVLHDGEEIEAGYCVEGGVLEFADGSRVEIAEKLGVVVLASLQTDGGMHSVIYIPEDKDGSVNVTVTPGSRFEVATPAAVAAVRGTRFTVSIWTADAEKDKKKDKKKVKELHTTVSVYEGEVVVTPRVRGRQNSVKAGKWMHVKCDKDENPDLWKITPKKPKKEK